MKKMYILKFPVYYFVFWLLLIGNITLAQDVYIGTDLPGNFYVNNLMTEKTNAQIYYTKRLQETVATVAGTRKWEFNANDYFDTWRAPSGTPIQIAAHNTVITPANTTASAFWRNNYGGADGARPRATTANSYYTFNISKQANIYQHQWMTVLETAYLFKTINTITQTPVTNITRLDDVKIDFTVSATPSATEFFYVRYTTNDWTSSSIAGTLALPGTAAAAVFSGTTGTAYIPRQVGGTTIKYYVFSSNRTTAEITTGVGTAAGQHAYNLLTLESKNDLSSYTVASTPLTFYMNDATTTGDIYCTAAGIDTNNGLTPATPRLTLASIYGLAAAGDTILIDTGTYGGSSNRFVDGSPINKAGLQIIGAGEDLTIFRKDSGTNIRWLTINGNNIKFSRMTVTNFNAGSDGIAIQIKGGTGIQLSNMLIYGNVGSAGQGAVLITGNTTSVTINSVSSHCNRIGSATVGGGYQISGSTVVFNDCTVASNICTTMRGAGIAVFGNTSIVKINRTIFDSNIAQSGGGLYIENGLVEVKNSCFTNNITSEGTVLDGGGAVLIDATSTNPTNIKFENCSFSNNSTELASSDGGAVTITNSTGSSNCTVTFTTCSFENNNASDKGEDVNFDFTQTNPVFDITFKNNTFKTLYTGTEVNLYNKDFPAAQIKFEALAGAGGNGNITTGTGTAITAPEMSGVFTETSSDNPVGLPITNCEDRFIGTCGTGFTLFCTKAPVKDINVTPLPTNVGFSTHGALQSENWPHNIPNGLLALDSKSKGFVLTRMSDTDRATIANPVEGMLIYNTTVNCIQLFNGVTWRCMVETCVD